MTVNEDAVQTQNAIANENPLFRSNSHQEPLDKLENISSNDEDEFIEDDLNDSNLLKVPPSSPRISSSKSPHLSPSSSLHQISISSAVNSLSSPSSPSIDSTSPLPEILKKRPSVVSTIGSVEEEIEHAQSVTSSKHRSIQSLASLEDDFGYFNETAKFMPRNALGHHQPHLQNRFYQKKQDEQRFMSLVTHGVSTFGDIGGAIGGISSNQGLYSLPPNPSKLNLKETFPRYKRQYKVESIYVNDLYTLTYDQDETLENVKSIVVHYRRNDREEIRRKLAMGVDDDQFMERPHRKPSLHSRLQSGMNLQICFMNETASDCESQCSDTESTQDREVDPDRVSTSSATSKVSTSQPIRTKTAQAETDRDAPGDFFARQAQLQAEARMALAQAKEMARMQMEIEKQSKNKSPISEIVRESFNKIGVPFPDSKRRISRQILTDMNVAQLQVIVNDLHTQIETLNEELVTYLMERDDLHMEQDSMLVDIEDLTKHIGAKELILREPLEGQDIPKITSLSTPPSRSKSHMKLKSIVKK